MKFKAENCDHSRWLEGTRKDCETKRRLVQGTTLHLSATAKETSMTVDFERRRLQRITTFSLRTDVLDHGA